MNLYKVWYRPKGMEIFGIPPSVKGTASTIEAAREGFLKAHPGQEILDVELVDLKAEDWN